MINVKNISKKFNAFALKNISFNLPKGQIMGLIGPNGSGKTTTIKLILNILKKQSGKIKIFNKDLIQNEIDIKEHIGVVLDSNYFLDTWTIPEVEKAIGMFYKNWCSTKFNSLIKNFNLNSQKRVNDLSKGMQMKLMLACALSHDAKLLILDEPTSGLDPVSRNKLLETLRDYIRDGEHSVLFSTHITTDLEKIADLITYINNGNLIYTGSKNQFTSSYKIANGKITDLNSDLENKLIGFKKFYNEFEGLIKEQDIKYFPEIFFKSASMDDIIIYTNKGVD